MISVTDHRLSNICAQAAQWGADQELEACCRWTAIVGGADALRAARRPEPPSLKEQALALINGNKPYLDDTAMDIIRRALEALDD
jgi:predicted DNA-binding transcriptional regulator YafY